MLVNVTNMSYYIGNKAMYESDDFFENVSLIIFTLLEKLFLSASSGDLTLKLAKTAKWRHPWRHKLKMRVSLEKDFCSTFLKTKFECFKQRGSGKISQIQINDSTHDVIYWKLGKVWEDIFWKCFYDHVDQLKLLLSVST